MDEQVKSLLNTLQILENRADNYRETLPTVHDRYLAILVNQGLRSIRDVIDKVEQEQK